jgi:hypothetical protein
MAEYVPRWFTPTETPQTPWEGTDRTDKRAFVSSVSALNTLPDHVREERPTKAANQAAAGVALTRHEAAALGLDPELRWVRVSREEVEASVPPLEWDGSLPVGCWQPRLCRVLGPCPHQRSGACCMHQETEQ